MSASKENKPAEPLQPTEDPKSAHATPIVEKYVEERKEKAEQQVERKGSDKMPDSS